MRLFGNTSSVHEFMGIGRSSREQQVVAISPFFKEAIEVSLGHASTFRLGHRCILHKRMTEYREIGCDHHTSTFIPHSKVEVDIHIIWKAIALVEETHLLEQLAAEGHTRSTYGLDFALLALSKMA